MKARWAVLFPLLGLSACGLTPPDMQAKYYEVATAPEALGTYDTQYDQNSSDGNFILGEFHYHKNTSEDDAKALPYYWAAAEAGHPQAQARLGDMLLSGRGTQSDPENAARWLRRAAKEGFVDAQTSLGALHEYGIGVPTDKYEAQKWYSIAAKRGDRRAMLGLGRIYRYRPNQAGEHWQEEAARWYERAAELGSAEAHFALGELYQTGVGVEADRDTAIAYYERAADLGDTKAFLSLAALYEEGDTEDVHRARMLRDTALEMGENSALMALAIQYEMGDRVEQSYERARELYEQAIAQGYPYAAYRLSQFYQQGLGVPHNRAEAMNLLNTATEGGVYAAHADIAILELTRQTPDMAAVVEHAQKAADNNDPLAMYLLSILHRHPPHGMQRDLALSAYWHAKAENTSGNAFAKYQIGRLYLRGKGFNVDREEAFRWLLWSAQQGVMLAQQNLGDLYLKGKGIAKSPTEAAHWYRKAAANGSAAAMYNMGLLYLQGNGAPKNFESAAQWIEMAAKARYRPAQYTLGELYYEGRGVKQSDRQAYAWWSLSQAGLLESDTQAFNHLIENMTPYELQKAVELSQSYQESYRS